MDTLTRQRGDVAAGRDASPARPHDGRARTAGPRRVDRITGVGLPDGRVVDLDIEGGVVVAVTEVDGADDDEGAGGAGPEAHRPAVIDGHGYLALTAPAEPHAHLDKALSWGATRPPGCDLGAAIDAWRAFSATVDEDEIHDRALEAARRLVASGTTAVRTHVDLHDDGDPLRGIRALVRVRDELADELDLQIVAMAGDDDPADCVRAAMEAGADLIGGAPHIAPDSVAETHRLIDLAEELGVGVDLHVDEFLDGDHAMLTPFTDRVASWEPGRIRTAGH
ncbi:cytosine deaminase, partial [Dietzia sp. DQ11-38-2]|nr:cytosine deaminase [Dietzia sp. DQ11-38-2]